eukprot:6380309-Heterocapsa_arctica.AAC.1
MVEQSRPSRKDAELYGGNNEWEESYRLLKLQGWDAEEDPEGLPLNLATEYRRYLEDQNALWKDTGG